MVDTTTSSTKEIFHSIFPALMFGLFGLFAFVLFSGGFVNLTLQSVSSSSCGSVCNSTCPCLSGYTCENGMCVQNSKSNTILNFSILDIIIVIAVILVVFIVVTRFKK